MIKVDIGYLKDEYTFILVSGHSNYDTKGKDLICAAVSSIVIGSLNNLKKIDSYDYTVKDGYVEVNFQNNIDLHDHTVIETVETQLLTIQDQYPDFIKVSRIRKE